MKRKIIGILVMTLLIASAVLPVVGEENNTCGVKISANSSDAEWSMTYGENRFEMLQCVQQTDDGGYIACGVKSAYDIDIEEDFFRPWVIKTNTNGDLEWEWSLYAIEYEDKFFSAYPDVYCMFIHQTIDGGFITGFRIQGSCDGDYWICALVKFDEYGEEIWREFCMDSLEWIISPHSLIEFDDGSFLIVGWSGTTEIDNMERQACLYKINPNGQEQWRQEFNYGEWDTAWALCKTSDNGYLLTGWADNSGNIEYWMIKTDSNGNKVWDKTFNGESGDFGHSRNCYQTSDGGYIMSGYTYSYGAGGIDAWIVKTDSMGNMEWNRTYGGKSKDICWSFESTKDDTYVFCVTYNYNSFSKADIHLVKADSDGHIIWVQEYGGEGRQIGQHICKTSDGGFIVSGRNGRYFNDESDGMLVKFAPFENQRPNKPTCKYDRASDELVVSATDPDGDQIKYGVDWDNDGVVDQWTELFDSGVEVRIDCEERTGTAGVTAEDEHGGQSDCISVKSISKPYINTPFLRFLENHPYMFPLLRQLLELK